MIACGASALASAAAVCVIALAFALYAALLPLWGSAWSAAGVAGASVLLSLFGAIFALTAASPQRARAQQTSTELPARLFDLARDKPIIAAAALVAVGVVVARSPKISTALLGAFLAGRGPSKK